MGSNACLLPIGRRTRRPAPHDVPQMPRLGAVCVARNLTSRDVTIRVRGAGHRLMFTHVRRPFVGILRLFVSTAPRRNHKDRIIATLPTAISAGRTNTAFDQYFLMQGSAPPATGSLATP